MATHSSILAWEVSWTGEPGGLQSMGLQRAGHNIATKPQPQQWPLGLFFLFFFFYEITKLIRLFNHPFLPIGITAFLSFTCVIFFFYSFFLN